MRPHRLAGQQVISSIFRLRLPVQPGQQVTRSTAKQAPRSQGPLRSRPGCRAVLPLHIPADHQPPPAPSPHPGLRRLAPLGVGTARRSSTARSLPTDEGSYPALGGRSAAEPARPSGAVLASWGPSQAAQSRPNGRPPGTPDSEFPALRGKPGRGAAAAAPVPAARQSEAAVEGPPDAAGGHSASLKAANKVRT